MLLYKPKNEFKKSKVYKKINTNTVDYLVYLIKYEEIIKE